MRLITKAHYLANTAPLFSQLKVLDINSINSFSVATFMYSYHHNLLPSSFRDLFLSSNQVHQYETRLAPQNRPHFFRTNIKQFQPPPHALPFSQGRGERLVKSRKGPWEGYRPQDLPDVSPDVSFPPSFARARETSGYEAEAIQYPLPRT